MAGYQKRDYLLDLLLQDCYEVICEGKHASALKKQFKTDSEVYLREKGKAV